VSEHPELDAEDAFEQARQRWTKKGLQASPKARKAREQQLRSTVDGRTLRTTGRTAQFNFKCRPDIKTNAVEAAKEDGLTIAEWLEAAIEAALAKRG
jgi:predicted HicB family RNase H-like nuclease